jgi:hypothetical protein
LAARLAGCGGVLGSLDGAATTGGAASEPLDCGAAEAARGAGAWAGGPASARVSPRSPAGFGAGVLPASVV